MINDIKLYTCLRSSKVIRVNLYIVVSTRLVHASDPHEKL